MYPRRWRSLTVPMGPCWSGPSGLEGDMVGVDGGWVGWGGVPAWPQKSCLLPGVSSTPGRGWGMSPLVPGTGVLWLARATAGDTLWPWKGVGWGCVWGGGGWGNHPLARGEEGWGWGGGKLCLVLRSHLPPGCVSPAPGGGGGWWGGCP